MSHTDLWSRPTDEAPGSGVNFISVEHPSGDSSALLGNLPGLQVWPGQGAAQHGQDTLADGPFLQGALAVPSSQQQQQQHLQQQQLPQPSQSLQLQQQPQPQGPKAFEQLVMGEMQRQLDSAASAMNPTHLHQAMHSCSLPKPSTGMAEPPEVVGLTGSAGRETSTWHPTTSLPAQGLSSLATSALAPPVDVAAGSRGLTASTADLHTQQAPPAQQQTGQPQCEPGQQQQPEGHQHGQEQQRRQPAGMPAPRGSTPSDAVLGTALEQVELAAAMEAVFALPPLPPQPAAVQPREAVLPSLGLSLPVGAATRGQEKDKKKSTWNELKQGVNDMEAEVERERAGVEQARLAGDMIERILDYQEDMASVLLAAKREEEEQQAQHHSLEPSQEYVSVYERHRAGPRSLSWWRSLTANPSPNSFFVNYDPLGIDLIKRYAPAGHREEADPQGRLTKAPPFIKVVQDYVAIVHAMEKMLEESKAAGEALVQRLGSSSPAVDAAEPAEAMAAGSAAARPQEMLPADEGSFKQRSSRVLSMSGAAAAVAAVRQAAPETAVVAEAGRAADMAPAARCSGSADVCVSPASSSVSHGAAEGSAEPGASHEVNTADVGLPSSPQPQPPPQQAMQQQHEVRGNKEGEDEEGEERWAVMLQRMVAMAETMGGLPGTRVEGGLLIQQPDGPYFFDQSCQNQVAKLMHKLSVLLWQQALFFPNHFLRLAITNLGTGEEDSGSEQSDELWDKMVESLMLRPCQLQLIAQLYREYTSKARTLRARRCKLVSRLQQVHIRMCTAALSAQEHAAIQLELAKLTSQIKQTCDAENAAYLCGAAGLFRAMLFPVQKMQLLTLSYPRFPLFNMVGEAVLRQLGLQQHT